MDPENQGIFVGTMHRLAPNRRKGCISPAFDKLRAGSPGGNASAIGLLSNCQGSGHVSPARWKFGLLPAKPELCYRAGQVSFRPRCSSVTGQHGWLGNAHARPHWASARFIAIGGRMSMHERESSFINVSCCRRGGYCGIAGRMA